MAIQLSDDDGRLDGEVLAQVIADEVGAGDHVLDVDIGVLHLAKVLAAHVGVVDGDGEGDPLDVGGDLGQIDLDLLIVALALAGEVVAHVLDGFAGVLQIAVEDELFLGGALAVAAHHERGGVQVKVIAGVKGIHVPAQAHHELGQAGGALGQVDFLSFCQVDRHRFSSLFLRLGCLTSRPR